jgi:hypothetical protein
MLALADAAAHYRWETKVKPQIGRHARRRAAAIFFEDEALLEIAWVILGVERVEYTDYCRLSCLPRGR